VCFQNALPWNARFFSKWYAELYHLSFLKKITIKFTNNAMLIMIAAI